MTFLSGTFVLFTPSSLLRYSVFVLFAHHNTMKYIYDIISYLCEESNMRGEMNDYYVYILASKKNGTLYTGVTNNLERRIHEHKMKLIDGFTKKYSINQLVYAESCHAIQEAINREKQIKGWIRQKKIALIESVNPEWNDLSLS